MAGFNSGLPLQLAFVDFLLQLTNPLALGVEHRDLVFDLDEREARKTLCTELRVDVLELCGLCVEELGPLAQVTGCLDLSDVVHEHESGYEVGVFTLGLAQELAEASLQHFAS